MIEKSVMSYESPVTKKNPRLICPQRREVRKTLVFYCLLLCTYGPSLPKSEKHLVSRVLTVTDSFSKRPSIITFSFLCPVVLKPRNDPLSITSFLW